jgi:PhnB protein
VKTKVNPVPDDFRTITPHLVVNGVAAAVEFYQKAFGADELYRNLAPDGVSIMHSELLLGDSRYFLNDEFPEHGTLAPDKERGSGITLHLYVPDVDSFYQRAVDAGAEIIFALADCFWGERYCILKDPFGHRWSFSSLIADLSPGEIQEKAKEYVDQTKSST